jgi:outer membrane protein assembly factor BamB
VGITGWRNSPVIENGAIYVGSAGVIQYVQDRRDGIYSLDLRTGQQRWLYSTELDVNAVAVHDGVVIALGDEGRVWALEDEGARGSLIWLDDLDVASFADPVFLGDDVILASGDGRIFAYNLRGGLNTKRTFPLTLEGAVRGGLSTDGERIYVASDSGHVVAFTPDRQIVWQRQLDLAGSGQIGVSAAPTISGELLILSVFSADGLGEPGVIALNRVTGEDAWVARDGASIKLTGWANMRSSPAVAGDYIIFGEGYSNLLVVLDRATGETIWSVEAGAFCFPHWPSPIVNTDAEGGAVAYLARHDGGLYAVDLTTQEIVWRIYLGNVEGEGRTGAFPPTHEDSDFCQWGPEDGDSIFGTPAVAADGTVVIGTGEGYIIAVGDPTSGE